jgi:EmrB/QacA subfamily drug resistance transporter
VAARQQGLGSGTVMALLAMGIAVFVIANDFTALSVALPQIEAQFGTTVSTVQWVINGYALVFGVLIVTGGRLADMFGRRRVFFMGSAIFATVSVLGGFAPGIGWLLAARAVMAVGGAMIWPAILGMTYAILPPQRAGLAGALILGAAGFGNAAGPLIGGLLTDTVGWRWVFFLNLPIAAGAVLVTWLTVHTKEAPTPGASRRIDVPGVVALSAGLLALLIALDVGTDIGWGNPRIAALLGISALALVGLAVIERRAGSGALVPGNVMGKRDFLAASLTVLMMSAIFFAALVYLPQFMAKQLRFSAVGAGAGLLPTMGTFAITAFAAGPLYGRLGPKRIVSLGAACLAAGMFLLSLLKPDSSYASMVPGMVILGIGVGLFYSSITTAGVTALDPSEASLAGGIIYMFQIAGGAVGLAVNTAIVAPRPLVEGIGIAFKLDAALAVVGLLIALLFVGGTVHPERLRNLRWHHRANA